MRKRTKATKERNRTYDTIPYRVAGIAYTVFLCRRCTKAWKLPNPVETWRLKNLVEHFASHDADSTSKVNGLSSSA